MKPLNVNNLLYNIHTYVWFQDYISFLFHRLVGTFQFGTTGSKKTKQPNLI